MYAQALAPLPNSGRSPVPRTPREFLAEARRAANYPPEPNARTVPLTCGYEYDNMPSWDAQPPAVPHFLPSPPPPPEIAPPKRRPRSTGCGTLIHTGATMAHVWSAPLAGTSAEVIPLDAAYFAAHLTEALRLGACGTCGCVRDGVGCRRCGNALGARLVPCTAHRDTDFVYTFLPCTVWPPLPFVPAPATPLYRTFLPSPLLDDARTPRFRSMRPTPPEETSATQRAELMRIRRTLAPAEALLRAQIPHPDPPDDRPLDGSEGLYTGTEPPRPQRVARNQQQSPDTYLAAFGGEIIRAVDPGVEPPRRQHAARNYLEALRDAYPPIPSLDHMGEGPYAGAEPPRRQEV
ncbi:hypothetical protein DFH07DRAFT_1012036 [Mycena maculata]|uniref:Uncharacterized protein n=1 Tax=Mycena maculata TaxID=230809 RepID=A0AAD7JM93_9AGAR|nr:hypothetical protein DFH07DRAFT_1012036 [Mycena maculata]